MGTLGFLGLRLHGLAWWVLFAVPMTAFMVRIPPQAAIDSLCSISSPKRHNAHSISGMTVLAPQPVLFCSHIGESSVPCHAGFMFLSDVLHLQAARISNEEQTLHQHFGAQWEQHCKRTWRLFPPLL